MQRFLALGDSYTIGDGVGADERWPAQLAARLRSLGWMVADPDIIARTGWTADKLWAAMDEARPIGPYDLISLLIGVNNQYRGQPVTEYRVQFAALLERAIGLAGGQPGRVLVLSIPDWSVTPFAAERDGAAIAAEIEAFNAVNAAAARGRAARYVDVTPISRLARTQPRLIAGDGLHPSGEMYRLWAEAALAEAQSALSVP